MSLTPSPSLDKTSAQSPETITVDILATQLPNWLVQVILFLASAILMRSCSDLADGVRAELAKFPTYQYKSTLRHVHFLGRFFLRFPQTFSVEGVMSVFQSHVLEQHLVDIQRKITVFKAIFKEVAHTTGLIRVNSERKSYSSIFKSSLIHLLDNDTSPEIVSEFTGISTETLYGFKDSTPFISVPVEDLKRDRFLTDLEQLWNVTKDRHKKSFEAFASFLVSSGLEPQLMKTLELDEQQTSRTTFFEKVRNGLQTLGFVFLKKSPNTPPIPGTKNNGCSDSIEVAPGNLVQIDGYFFKVILNGREHSLCYTHAVDAKSDHMYEGVISTSENSAAVRGALANVARHNGRFPAGMLIDNRCNDPENLPVIETDASQVGVIVIHSFPGNAKTKAAVEGSHAFYSAAIGKRKEIILNYEQEDELAEKIGRLVFDAVEAKRNTSPRRRLQCKTPREIMEDGVSEASDAVKTLLNSLRSRFERSAAIAHDAYALLSKETATILEERTAHNELACFQRQLPKYLPSEIADAERAFLVQVHKNPHVPAKYTARYFLGVLRNKREDAAKRSVIQSELNTRPFPLSLVSYMESTKKLGELLERELLNLHCLRSPFQRLQVVISIARAIAPNAAKIDVPSAWRRFLDTAQRTHTITAKALNEIIDLMGTELGDLLVHRVVSKP